MKRINKLNLGFVCSSLLLGMLLPLASCSSTSYTFHQVKQLVNDEASIEVKGETVLKANKTTRLKASLTNFTKGEVIWTSSDENVATVDATGLVTGLKGGSVTITASLEVEDGKEPLTAEHQLKVIALEDQSFKVSFVNYDGTLLYEDVVEFGHTAAFKGEHPRKSADENFAYIFKGWDKDIDNIQADTVFTAVYTKQDISEYVFTPVSGADEYMLYAYLGSEETVEIPSSYQGKPVTRVDSSAFTAAKTVKKIILPDSIGIILDGTFQYLSTLEEIVIPDSVYSLGKSAFNYCSSLKKVTLPKTLKSIPEDLFYRCEKLTDVVIPESVTRIEEEAFRGCTSLEKINFPAKLKEIGENAFNGTAIKEVKLGDEFTTLAERAFYQCKSLTSVTLSKNITVIPKNCFYECTSLTSFDLSNIVEIKDSGFAWSGLTSVELPDTITALGRSVFDECTKLRSVKWTKGVKVIPQSMFNGAENLTSVTNLEEVTEISNNAFQDTGFTNVDSTNLLKGSLTKIGNYAFSASSKLLTVSVPGNVKTVGNSAFRAQKALTSVTFEEGVETLGDTLFEDCAALKEVSFPASLKKIGKNMFSGCSYLKEYNLGENVTNAKSVDGVIYSKDGTQLMNYPGIRKGTTYTPIETCTRICENAFGNNLTLETVDLSGITYFERNGFKYSMIDHLNVGPNVKTFSTMSFAYLTGTSAVTIEGNYTSLATYLFQDSTGLKTVTLPETLTKIDSGFFSRCTNLESVNLPVSVKTIANYAFYNVAKVTLDYKGEKDQFKSITTSSSSFSAGAKVKCTNGTLEFNGTKWLDLA